MNKPLVAAIDGYAIGLGLESALTADFRIASDTAKLRMRLRGPRAVRSGPDGDGSALRHHRARRRDVPGPLGQSLGRMSPPYVVR
ncbi:enoyl-CoA hydratase-related protein [Streptomyces sp. NPDC055103]